MMRLVPAVFRIGLMMDRGSRLGCSESDPARQGSCVQMSHGRDESDIFGFNLTDRKFGKTNYYSQHCRFLLAIKIKKIPPFLAYLSLLKIRCAHKCSYLCLFP